MNKNDVRSGVFKSWDLLKAFSVAGEISNPNPLVPSEAFMNAALSDDHTYEDLYLTGLRYKDFNLSLIDFSYLQFGISEERHVRYAYYPNPFLGTSQQSLLELNELREYLDEGLIDAEEYLQKIAELRRTQHPPLLRYENAPNQYVERTHPCSHFHLGHDDGNRWPIKRLLTPLAFSMLIVRHFYPDSWVSQDSVKLKGRSDEPDKFYEEERMACSVLGDDLFSNREGRLFHFF